MTGDTLVIQICRPALTLSQVCDLTFYRAKGAQARVAGRGRWRRVSAGEQMQQRRLANTTAPSTLSPYQNITIQ